MTEMGAKVCCPWRIGGLGGKPINNIHTTITLYYRMLRGQHNEIYCALKIALHTLLEIAFVQAFVATLVRIDC